VTRPLTPPNESGSERILRRETFTDIVPPESAVSVFLLP